MWKVLEYYFYLGEGRGAQVIHLNAHKISPKPSEILSRKTKKKIKQIAENEKINKEKVVSSNHKGQ